LNCWLPGLTHSIMVIQSNCWQKAHDPKQVKRFYSLRVWTCSFYRKYLFYSLSTQHYFQQIGLLSKTTYFIHLWYLQALLLVIINVLLSSNEYWHGGGGQLQVTWSTQTTTGSTVSPCLHYSPSTQPCPQCYDQNLSDWGPVNIFQLRPWRAEDFHSMLSQSSALTKHVVGEFILLSILPAYSITWVAHNIWFKRPILAFFSHLMILLGSMSQYTEAGSNPVTSLHCFLSKASKSVDSFSEGPSMKIFDCLILLMAAQHLEGILFSHSLILSLPTRDETGVAGSGPRNGLLHPFLAKAFVSLLPWIPLQQGTKRSITFLLLLTFPDQIQCCPWCLKCLQCCLAI
jgi:hypothetical protein